MSIPTRRTTRILRNLTILAFWKEPFPLNFDDPLSLANLLDPVTQYIIVNKAAVMVVELNKEIAHTHKTTNKNDDEKSSYG